MKINFHYLQQTALNVKDQLLSSLTPQTKKILIIAAVALSGIAVLYVLCTRCFKAHNKTDQAELDNKGAKETVQQPQDDEKGAQSDVVAQVLSDTVPRAEGEEKAEAEQKKIEEDAPVKKGLEEETQAKEAADRKAQEEALKKALEDETHAQEAVDKKAQEEAVQKALDDERLAQEAALKKAQEEEAAKKAAEEARIAKEAADQKARDEAAADRKAQKIVNVLLVGRSRSGKTTLMNVLEDPFFIAPEGSMFFSTVLPKESETKLNGCTFKVLDTPGLFETAKISSGNKTRSNEELAKLIADKAAEVFGGNAFENVDVVIFTNTTLHAINQQEVETLDFLLPRFLPQTKKIFAITQAEGLLKVDAVREQCSRATDLSSHIATHFGGKEKILFSGAISQEELTYEDKMTRLLNNVFRMRDAMIDALLPDSVTLEEKAEFKKQQQEEFDRKLPDFISAHQGEYDE